MKAVSLDNLKAELENKGFEFKPAEHAHWRARKDGITVTYYKSGKVLVQGKGSKNFLKKCHPELVSGSHEMLKQVQHDRRVQYKSWIGTDESGKGDYFGPLVIAGVLADENNLDKLADLGIQDSKKMSDSSIQRIAPKIKQISVFSVVTINPAKYNELYEKFKNLNNLLAWGHARAIENILEKAPCEHALSDKFGNETLIKNALLKKGQKINLEQKTKAESDVAVAAASVLARNEFLHRLKQFSSEYGVTLPKGVSEEVIAQARVFLKKHGPQKLRNVAKIHFKTTKAL